MRRVVSSSVVVVALAAACSPERTTAPRTPSFSTGIPINLGSKEAYTLAVVGDMPYGTQKLDSLPLLIDSIEVLFNQLKDPFVYTPGDNEWTDCTSEARTTGCTRRPSGSSSCVRCSSR